LGFFSTSAALLIVDVRTCHHQSCIQFFDDGILHWSNEKTNSKAQPPSLTIGRYPKKQTKRKTIPASAIKRKENKQHKKKPKNEIIRGPCVVSQHEKFKEKFLKKLSSNPFYFQHHSVAYILYDDEVCYGLGEYTVSELLARFYLAYKVKPWDSAYKSLLGVPGFLEGFLEGPKTMSEEYKLYKKGYDPALFRQPQQVARSEFRLNFRLVYGKSTFRKKPVISMFFKERKETKKPNSKTVLKPRNNRTNTKCIWAFCFEDDEIPTKISTRGSSKEEITGEFNEEFENSDSDEIIPLDTEKEKDNPVEYNNFSQIDPEVKEDWFRYSGRIISLFGLGVGPHDWQIPYTASQFAINKETFDPEVDKDPEIISTKRKKDIILELEKRQKLEAEKQHKLQQEKKRKAEIESKGPVPKKRRGGNRKKERDLKNLHRDGTKYKTSITIDFPLRNAYLKSISHI